MTRLTLNLLTLTLAMTLTACSKGPAPADAKAADANAAPLLIAPLDLVSAQSNELSSGPSITGTVQPERRADLRSELSTVVMQVLKDNGDKVKRGELLVRLDDTAIRDSLSSAQEAVRAAQQSFEQAERQFQRLKTLRESGMASTQQLEDAEVRRNTGQSDLAAARTREVQARQQLQHTLVTAPFDGIVSERKVSAGDTAQIGKELLKVMDPNSMRLEGLVSADAVAQLKVGQGVSFRVNGYGAQEFLGKVKRINPAANANTRQLEVLVDFAQGQQPQLAGLYAEGQVQAARRPALMLSAAALQREGDKAFVWRVKDGTVQKLSVTLGERDARSGEFVVLAGVAAGEPLIRNPTSALKDGQKVQVGKAAASVAAASSAPASAASGTGK